MNKPDQTKDLEKQVRNQVANDHASASHDDQQKQRRQREQQQRQDQGSDGSELPPQGDITPQGGVTDNSQRS